MNRDTEAISKLLNFEFGNPNNTLGKHVLLTRFPEIKDMLYEERDDRKILDSRACRRVGLSLGNKSCLIFTKRDFPELFED